MKYVIRYDQGKKIKDTTVYPIIALRGMGNFHVGELGGFVENEHNLSQEGWSWIYPKGVVMGKMRLEGNTCLISGVLSGSTLKEVSITSNPKEEKEPLEWTTWRRDSFISEEEALSKNITFSEDLSLF